MSELTREELQSLMEIREEPCISIFVPTQRTGSEAQQASIRLKNLLRRAENDLAQKGFRPQQIQKFLKPASQFVGDSLFWQHQQNGLAIFISPNLFRYFQLPIEVQELAVVGSRFYIKPLLRLFSFGDRFYVLGISQKQVRLLHCTPHSSARLEMEGAPASLDEVLKYDDPEKQVHFHTRAPSDGDGFRAAVSYGHGDENYLEKENLRRYFSQIDRALIKTLGADQAPLIFAGVDFLFPLFRETSDYPQILDHIVEGNPDLLRDNELKDRAWQVVQPVFEKKLEKAAARFYELQGTGKASSDIREVAPSSANGRVDLLFVAAGKSLPGTVDLQAGTARESNDPDAAGQEDLLDFAAAHTFLNGGTVYPVPPDKIPGDSLVAAIYRY